MMPRVLAASHVFHVLFYSQASLLYNNSVTSQSSNPGQPTPSIILIGIMGSGKTTVGREISRNLGLPLIDTDAMIETRTGTTISDIFATRGEDHFRDLETELLRDLASRNAAQIIATGGGIVIRPENRELLRKLGYVVWINADIDVLFDRVARYSHRPLLHTPNPKKTLQDLLELRSPWYQESAHLTIDTSNLTIQETVVGIVESARVFFHDAH